MGILKIKHFDDGTVGIMVEFTEEWSVGVKIDRDYLASEIAFPRRTEDGSWIRLRGNPLYPKEAKQ